MRILERNLLTSLLSVFIFCVLLFLLLYVLIDACNNIEEMLDRKVDFATLMEYYLSFLPMIFVQTAPIACLMAGLLTLSNMNMNNEVIAMRTAGLSFWMITRPIIWFGIIISLLIMTVNEAVVPQAVALTDKIKNERMVYARHRKSPPPISNLTFLGLKNRLYFISSFDPGNDRMEGITILEQDDKQNLKSKIVALKGNWFKNHWKFYQVQVLNFDEEGQMAGEIEHYDEKVMDISESVDDFLRQRVQVSAMNLKQLSDYILKFKYSGARMILRNLKVDFHSKIAYPFSNLIILLVGLPFGLMTKRRKGITFAALGLCLIIGFFYYVFNAVFLALGKSGNLPPVLAAWATNIAFIFLAQYLIRKVA